MIQIGRIYTLLRILRAVTDARAVLADVAPVYEYDC